jgi:DNA modification methylase
LGVKKQVWFGANYYCHHLPETNNWLVWDKRVEEKMENTNSDCELAWVLDGHKSCRIFRYLWNGLLKAGERDQKRVHPTQKPIALIDHCVKRYAPEAKTMLDLFGGSGSTLIAAEQLGIKCFINELDTHYCNVIIARWEKLTGNKAQKIAGAND